MLVRDVGTCTLNEDAKIPHIDEGCDYFYNTDEGCDSLLCRRRIWAFCRWNSYVNCVRCSGPYLDGKFVVHDGIFDSVITSMMDYLMVWIVSMIRYEVQG